MTRLVRRLGAGLTAAWSVPGSTAPKGTYPAIFALASYCLAQAAWEGRPLNIVDVTLAALSGFLVASSFISGFRAESLTVE